MDVIVCMKQVIDPEAPPASFKIDPATNRLLPAPGVAQVLDPYSENALEAALRLKDSQGARVVVISLGSALNRDVVKKALALGADELVLLEDPDFADSDSAGTAYALSLAIKKLGRYDLVLCGRQASDGNAGQVAFGIAEMLGITPVSPIQKLEISGQKARVERKTADGYEVVEVALPAVAGVSNELGQIRYPNIKGILAAKKKEPTVWKPADIGADPSRIGTAGRRSRLVKLYQPVRQGTCQMVPGHTPEEQAANLVTLLRQSKLI